MCGPRRLTGKQEANAAEKSFVTVRDVIVERNVGNVGILAGNDQKVLLLFISPPARDTCVCVCLFLHFNVMHTTFMSLPPGEHSQCQQVVRSSNTAGG